MVAFSLFALIGFHFFCSKYTVPDTLAVVSKNEPYVPFVSKSVGEADSAEYVEGAPAFIEGSHISLDPYY
jgi:hypothetical protein